MRLQNDLNDLLYKESSMDNNHSQLLFTLANELHEAASLLTRKAYDLEEDSLIAKRNSFKHQYMPGKSLDEQPNQDMSQEVFDRIVSKSQGLATSLHHTQTITEAVRALVSESTQTLPTMTGDRLASEDSQPSITSSQDVFSSICQEAANIIANEMPHPDLDPWPLSPKSLPLSAHAVSAPDSKPSDAQATVTTSSGFVALTPPHTTSSTSDVFTDTRNSSMSCASEATTTSIDCRDSNGNLIEVSRGAVREAAEGISERSRDGSIEL